MYLMQIWFNLSDEGIEDSIYDSYAMRTFMHIDLMNNNSGTIVDASLIAAPKSTKNKILKPQN